MRHRRLTHYTHTSAHLNVPNLDPEYGRAIFSSFWGSRLNFAAPPWQKVVKSEGYLPGVCVTCRGSPGSCLNSLRTVCTPLECVSRGRRDVHFHGPTLSLAGLHSHFVCTHAQVFALSDLEARCPCRWRNRFHPCCYQLVGQTAFTRVATSGGGAMDTRRSYGHGQGPGYSQVLPHVISALAANVKSAFSTHVCFDAHVCLHPSGAVRAATWSRAVSRARRNEAS